MKNSLILILVIILASCHNSGYQNSKTDKTKNTTTNYMAKRIKITDLFNTLTLLQNGKTEYNFIGITSNGIDCIYFVFEKGKFNIEFEAMIEQQVPYINKIKGYATSKSFHILMTTYNNKPKYKSSGPAPVIRIETNSTLEEINKIGIDIQAQIFNNNPETVYDIVP